jgi:formamidopyrimidine-DNA glycosylase
MPELPEVETIAANLRQGRADQASLIGRRIRQARLLWERTLAWPSPAEFYAWLPGQVIGDIRRRGKFIVFTLDEHTLLVHLRMSGDLLVEPAAAPLAPHHRLVIDLDGDLRLAFNDARKFGRLWLTADPQSVLGSLGPEPLDESFTAQDLHRALHARQRQLKPLLLDQSFLAGLGNIYTDEALHVAGLHPLTVSNSLSPQQSLRLWQSIRQVLQEAILRNGASIDWVYRGGDYQHFFKVYQRTGNPCYNCGTPIERLIVGQRGTHYCPNCQPLK